jgi:hypothetical protein
VNCHGLNCSCTTLVDAHILPRAFARDILEDRTHNMQVSPENARPTQHGVFDKSILCGACDSQLGKFDDYAVGVIRSFEPKHIQKNGSFLIPDVDGDKFALFALAVLWRASISKRPEVTSIRLGPYENIARDVLFGAKALSEMRQYELVIDRYIEPMTSRICGLPSHVNNLGVHGWGFLVRGFRFVAKIDNRSWPSVTTGGRAVNNRDVVNGKDFLTGRMVPFAGTDEQRSVFSLAKAEQRRRATKAARSAKHSGH